MSPAITNSNHPRDIGMGEVGAKHSADYKGKWIAHTKGGPDKRAYEIVVLREDNKFGMASYGWFDDGKLLVLYGGGPTGWTVSQEVWDELVGMAEKIAARRNENERH